MAYRSQWAVGMVAVGFGVLVAVSALSINGRAANGDDESESRIKRGFEIAPVHLNMRGKNPELVGMGSYLVNAIGDCNGCHAGPLATDPTTAAEYAPGGDPFMGQPAVVNQSTYLAGGTLLFGPFVPRNLTPDKTGRPEGGASYAEFLSILRTGIDPDHAHPQFGPFLQVMPWPTFHNMTDHDIRAIYEYLSAIPCIEGDPGLPNPRPIGTRCQ